MYIFRIEKIRIFTIEFCSVTSLCVFKRHKSLFETISQYNRTKNSRNYLINWDKYELFTPVLH